MGAQQCTSCAVGLEAITGRLEAIAIRLEAIAAMQSNEKSLLGLLK